MPESDTAPDSPRDFLSAAREAPARRELHGWALLGIGALALAGLLALLLAVSRIPGAETIVSWPLDFFHRALTVHVVLSIIVWNMAVMAALALLAALGEGVRTPAWRVMGAAGLVLSIIGVVFLVVSGFSDRGEAALNNYVPVILDPVYTGGLTLVFIGIALPALRVVVRIGKPPSRPDPVAFAVTASALAYLVALMCIWLAWNRLHDIPPSAHYYEELFWGGGHVLQFVNLALMLACWFLLGSAARGTAPMSPRLFRGAIVLLLLGCLPALALDTFADDPRQAFSALKYVLAVPALMVALGLVWPQPDRPRVQWRDPAVFALATSMAVFGLGGVLGFFVDGADTRTPSHYHGVLGGVNLAFMGVYWALLLPLLNRAPRLGRRHLWQMGLYAVGQALQCIGLFLAGGYGAPRKTAGAEQGLEALGAKIGLWLNGGGALIAVIGGVMFIWMAGLALLRRPPD